MKLLGTILFLLTLSNSAHAGLLQAMANYYNSRDHCQLKNYPGGVKHADVRQLPSYCGKSNYSRQQRMERAIQSGRYVVPVYPSGYPIKDRVAAVARVSTVGNALIVYHLDGQIEYIPKP